MGALAFPVVTTTFAEVSSPFFSIVMPSYLGAYEGNYGRSASDRLHKFDRAIRSCMDQSFRQWELIVVADGCEDTWLLRHKYMDLDRRVRFVRIPKQRLWSGVPRNTGIYSAGGLYITYLDTDDQFGSDHLASLAEGIADAGSPALVISDDLIYDQQAGQWVRRIASASKQNTIGTSNIHHRRDLGAYWPEITYRWPSMGYDHDLQFYRHLLTMAEPVHVDGGQYYVMHIPRTYDL